MTPAEAAKQLECEVSSMIFEINKKVLSQSIRAVRTMYNAALTKLDKDGFGLDFSDYHYAIMLKAMIDNLGYWRHER